MMDVVLTIMWVCEQNLHSLKCVMTVLVVCGLVHIFPTFFAALRWFVTPFLHSLLYF